VPAAIRLAARRFEALLLGLVAERPVVKPVDLMTLEASVHAAVARECCDAVVASVIRSAHESNAVRERAQSIIDQVPDLVGQRSGQEVKITLYGGSVMSLRTPYCLRRPPPGPGHPRRRGSRTKEGNGLYPRLEALGIICRVTPALASEVARLTATGTFAEAAQTLALRSVVLGGQVIRRITKKVAERGLRLRAAMIRRTQAGHRGTRLVDGKRLVISTDGGRVRIRTQRRGRARKSGWHGFKADWREPKVLVVYEIDERGRKVRRGFVRYDATMGDADKTFELLVAILRDIGAHEAAEWITVADGALWIWDRIDKVVEALGYDPRKVTKVLDWFHAIEHLHEIAQARKGWSESKREAWVRKMKRHLHDGQVDKLLQQRSAVCLGRNAKTLGKKFDYFEQRRSMLAYKDFRARAIPCGSGAVESCVRRLVNLRMKGNGIFWGEGMAEALLHLRAQFLAGTWRDYMALIFEHEALRWSAAAQAAA
jgi:hypothetical protein